MRDETLADIRDLLFTPERFAQIVAKVALIGGSDRMIAEDDAGGTYNYSLGEPPDPSPPETRYSRGAEFFGVEPRSIEEVLRLLRSRAR